MNNPPCGRRKPWAGRSRLARSAGHCERPRRDKPPPPVIQSWAGARQTAGAKARARATGCRRTLHPIQPICTCSAGACFGACRRRPPYRLGSDELASIRSQHLRPVSALSGKLLLHLCRACKGSLPTISTMLIGRAAGSLYAYRQNRRPSVAPAGSPSQCAPISWRSPMAALAIDRAAKACRASFCQIAC